MTEAEATALSVAGRLLAYPNREFFAMLPDLRSEAAEIADASPDAAAFPRAVIDFIDQLTQMGQAQSAEQYVAIFDHAPSATLYMSWRRYGNDRGQGKAMAALNGLYRTYGFEPYPGALPDYLPVMLEFLAHAPDEARRILLDGFGPEINDLLKNLKEMESAHASMLTCAMAPLQRDFPEQFKSRLMDPTRRPMAQPEPEPAEPLIPPPVLNHRKGE